MKYERRFMIAPALVRLIQRERLVSRDMIEGYLSRTPDRVQFVRIEPDGCTVLLVRNDEGRKTEDRAKISGEQAEALVDICQGRLRYRRNVARIGQGLDVCLEQYEGLDLVSVQFDEASNAATFQPPAWFGPEVTEEPAYQRSSFAIDGIPEAEEIPASNATIIAYLDALPANAAGGRRGAAFALPELHPEEAAVEREVGTSPALATLPGPSEQLEGVLAGLTEALTTVDPPAEKKRAPFLVPVSGVRARA